MNKTQLIGILNDIPEDWPVWIGVDSGDGWVPLDSAFFCNAIDAPLDGDELSNAEIEYRPVKKGATFGPYEIVEESVEFGEVTINKPIIVLGDRTSHDWVQASREKRIKDTQKEKLEKLKKKKALLEKELKEVTREIDLT